MLELNHLFLEGIMNLGVPIPFEQSAQFRNYFEFQLKAADKSTKVLMALKSLKHFENMPFLETAYFTMNKEQGENKIYISILNT